ncbi:MAG: ABC transporter permease [Myxococcota bacterium]
MKLSTLIRRDLSRTKGRFIIVGSAVAMGVAVLVFFGALGAGIYRGIVEPMLPKLPLDLIKVEPRFLSFGPLAFDAGKLGGGLDESVVKKLEGIPGVDKVYPLLGTGFALHGEGGGRFLGGAGIRTDLFANGIDPELMKKDVAAGKKFEDPGPGARVVPVILARRLVDLYNTTVAPAIQRPKISEDLVIGFSFDLVLGSSYVRGTPDPSNVEQLIAEVVGFSDQASIVGITVPAATIRRWNDRHAKGVTPVVGAFVKTKSKADAGPVAQAIEKQGLSVDDTMKLVGAVVASAGVLLSLFGLVLLGMAAFAIAQTFFLLVGERRFELAVLRAMGARRRDLRRMVLIEATIMGTLSGLAGLVIGVLASVGFDALAISLLPEVALKPASIVAFPPLLLLLAWVLGVLSAVGGAYFPARRAAQADPALALRSA